MDTDAAFAKIRELNPNGSIARVEVEGDVVTVFTARPGILIGKRGTNLGILNEKLEEWFGRPMQLSIQEVRKAGLEAQLVADTVLLNLSKGVDVTRMARQALNCRSLGGECRIRIRLDGAEHEFVDPAEAVLEGDDVEFAQVGDTIERGDVTVEVWIRKPSA